MMKPTEPPDQTTTDLQNLIANLKKEQAAAYERLKSRIDYAEKMCLRDEAQLQQVRQDLCSLQRSMSAIYDEKIFEHQVYGTKFSELIKEAYFTIRSPRTVDRIFNWGLRPEQRSIRPYEYDVMAGIILLCKLPSEANSNTLDGMVPGRNKGEIKRSAENLMKRGYVTQQHSQAARKKRGPRPTNFKLTTDGLALLLGSLGSRSTRDLKTHRDMELKRFRQAIRQRPIEVYMSIRQIPGARCDATVRARKDSENFSEVRAINIETDADVQQDSSTQPDQEGEVYVGMVTSFVLGAKYLEIAHQKTSMHRLVELWTRLPKWMRDQITFTEV
jgi:hypothetical protein